MKWIYRLLIATFIALVVGGAISTAQDHWRMHQDAMVRMQENLLKQQQKQQEISDRIAQTRAKPTLSDHDRWLITHLEKTRAGLDKILVTQQSGVSRLQRSFLRTWIGNLVLFIALAGLGLGIVTRSGNALNKEEQHWLASRPEDIPSLRLDPGAHRNATAPTRNASNFVTGRIRAVKADRLQVKRSGILSAMGLSFIIAPQGGLMVELYFLYDALMVAHIPFQQLEWGGMMQSLMLSIPFTLAGLYLLASSTSQASIDRHEQRITLPEGPRTIAFREVESIQLNQILSTGERSYLNSQIQLNLNNGEVLSLLSHGGKEQIYVDLIRTALFMDKPAVLPQH
ncbi:hypothetical protein [Alcanivorax sp.]|jgi:hypothetical protein|uniref:hypothetical protein n=1 Tax=Alcanivorax sp. TaxID=1872427 RepID=UPI0039E55FDA